MANGNMNLVLSLSGRDNGARDLLRRVNQEISSNASLRRRLAHVDGRMAQLGIRSERQIRMEILQTQAAYNRLARSGRASHNDLARAATATRNRIRELNDELRQGAGGWRSRMGAIWHAGYV